MHDPLNLSWITQFRDQTQDKGVVIRINPEFASNVTQRMAPYKAFPYRMRPALEKVGDYVRTEMIPRTFKQEGPGWRKLSKRTVRERIAQGYPGEHPILYRSGDLFKELSTKGHPKHVEIISTGRNARIELGGSSEKFIRNQGGNWMLHIPSRPMIPGTGTLPLPDRDRKNIRNILYQGIMDLQKKK